MCLATVDPQVDCVVCCPNRHYLHSQCMVAMLVKMGTDKCPYCMKPILMVVQNMRPVSLLARAGIAIEHCFYEALLVFLLFFSAQRRPRISRLNRSVALLRMKYSFLDRHYDSVVALRMWAVGTMLTLALAFVLAVSEWMVSQIFGRWVDVLAMGIYCSVVIQVAIRDD